MLIEDTFRDELAGFTRHAKVTADDLRLLVSRIDWRGDHAPALAREHLTQRLGEALAAAEALAAEKAIPLQRLWRNLVATASQGDEGVYRLLLDHAERLGQKPLGDAQGQIREALAPTDPTTAAIIDFLNAAGPPSPDLLHAIAPAQRVARFLSFARAEVRRMGSDSQRLADRLLRGASGIFGANRPDRAVSHTAVFLAIEGLDARLSPTQMVRLEDGLRSALLNAKNLWAKLLSRSALEEAKAQTRKARSLGAAETVPSLQEALETIAAGHLADARVLPALALWPLKARELRLLEQAIQRIPAAPPDLRNPRLVGWLQRQPPQPALLALSLLARPKERWVATMAAWDEAELKSAVRLVGPDRAVAVFFEADTPLSLWRRFVAVPGHATIVLRASGLRLYALLAASTQDATFDQALPKLLQLIMLCDPSGECVLRGDGLGMPRAEVFRHASHRRLRRFLDLPELRRLRLKHPAINALAAAALLCLRGRCLSTRSDEPDNKQQRCFGHYLRSLKANLDLVSRIPDTELLPEELDLILNAPARGRCSSPCVSATTPPSSPCALSRSSSPSRSAVRARIVSEETLGISGGLCIAENLQTQYAERRGGGASNPGEGGDWYFAPAGLRGLTALEGRLARPLQVSVEPSDEHGFLLAVSGLDWRHPGWHAAQHGVSRASLGSLGLPELATDLEQHSTLGTAGIGLGSLLARLPRKRPTSKHATFQWAPASAEAIVRFSALLAAGQTLRLDPGERYPQRAIVSVALRLPDDQPSELDVRLIRTAPVLTSGLWAELGDAVPTPPWSGVFDRMDAHIS